VVRGGHRDDKREGCEGDWTYCDGTSASEHFVVCALFDEEMGLT